MNTFAKTLMGTLGGVIDGIALSSTLVDCHLDPVQDTGISRY